MQFQFSFKQMGTSDALRAYAQSKIDEVVSLLVTKPIEAHVTFAIDRHSHTARCAFTGGDNFSLQVEHTTEDMYKSVDGMVAKLESQLRKKKEKIKAHKGNTNVRTLASQAAKKSGVDEIDAADILKFEAAKKRLKGTGSR